MQFDISDYEDYMSCAGLDCDCGNRRRLVKNIQSRIKTDFLFAGNYLLICAYKRYLWQAGMLPLIHLWNSFSSNNLSNPPNQN